MLKAEALHRQGQDAEALALLQDDIPAAFASTDLPVRRKLTQALAYTFTQQLPQADRVLREAEELATAHHPELLGEVALRKGTLYFYSAEPSRAEAEYRKALQSAQGAKDLFLEAAALTGLGVLATKEEHYDESIDWNRRAVQLAQAIGAGPSLAQALGNTGWSYFELGDYENALQYYQQAEETAERGGLIADRVYWLTSIAYVRHALHEYGAAEKLLRRALELARKQDDKTIVAQCLNQLTDVALTSGQISLAETYNAEASAFSASQIEGRLVIDALYYKGWIAQSKRDDAGAERFLKEVVDSPGVLTSQRWQAQARLASVYAEEKRNADAEREFRQSLASMESVRASVKAEDLRLSLLSSGVDFYGDYVEFLIAQHRPEDALQVAELSRARTLAEGLGAASKNISFPLRGFEPQRIALREHGTLLFYWVAEKQSYVWVISQAKIMCVTLAPSGEIDGLVKSYRQAVLGGRDVLASGGTDGSKLYNLLVEPAKKWIPPNSRLILLPDGSLYGLNFETLIVPEPKPHFWIEDVTLSTAASLTLLATRAGKPEHAGADALRSASKKHAGIVAVSSRAEDGAGIGGRLLLVGNANSSSADFPPLRQAASEIDHVGHYFPESRREVLAGAQATPGAFLQHKPEGFGYLHFVTHGTASRAHPLDSAVILSPDARDGGSYKLYAREIVKHRLSAYLVTISACNGSGTRAYSGEGLVGLSWAFLRAGAHNVIAALWEVNDASTPQLMDAMYGELARGSNPAEALRAAKLSLLHSDSVFRKPFYWAPFQLYSGS